MFLVKTSLATKFKKRCLNADVSRLMKTFERKKQFVEQVLSIGNNNQELSYELVEL